MISSVDLMRSNATPLGVTPIFYIYYHKKFLVYTHKCHGPLINISFKALFNKTYGRPPLKADMIKVGSTGSTLEEPNQKFEEPYGIFEMLN